MIARARRRPVAALAVGVLALVGLAAPGRVGASSPTAEAGDACSAPAVSGADAGLVLTASARKDPACIRACGQSLDSALRSCQSDGRGCLRGCNVEDKLAACAMGCLAAGGNLAPCLATCGGAGLVITSCMSGCVDRRNACLTNALAGDKRCQAGCPDVP